MKKHFLHFALISLIVLSNASYAQQLFSPELKNMLDSRGEVYFTFSIHDPSEMEWLTKNISIDKVSGNEVYAYANRREMETFLQRGYSFTLLPAPSLQINEADLRMGAQTTDLDGRTVWNFYPTYQQYIDYMVGFATTYPSICQLDTIGTSLQGRLILVLKISDSVQYERGKPQFLYTSSIHGDELTGYVLMLHLIDYLLSNYGSDPRITDMINNTQIYINPLANPDGTFHGGNNTVYGATRFNANNIDLNRNYPDPADGPHPDGNAWQPETMIFMEYADSNHFAMSMNFHGGAEVFNYPWDTWAKLNADNDWYDFLGREYADTVHLYGPTNYMTDLDNGVTNGYVWYRITGGRQDYMTYFHHGREVTLEISDVKTPAASQLLNFWNYNYRSFLNYIEQVNYGINGQVTDSITGQPLNAKLYIFNYDFDNSFVYSNLPSGWYYRPIEQGVYDLTFSLTGYRTKTIKEVSVSKWSTTRVNVQLVPNTTQVLEERSENLWTIYPNPCDGLLKIVFNSHLNSTFTVSVTNLVGQTLLSTVMQNGNTFSLLDMSSIDPGLYFITINDGFSSSTKRIILK